MTHNFNSLVKFGLGLFMAGSASLMLVGCDKAPSGNSSSASQDHLARIKSAGELKVGLEGDWQPFSFHDEKDELVVQSINTLSIKQMRTRCLQASISSGRSPVPHSLA